LLSGKLVGRRNAAALEGELGQLAHQDPRIGFVRLTQEALECACVHGISIPPRLLVRAWMEVLLEQHAIERQKGRNRPVTAELKGRLCGDEIGAEGGSREDNLRRPGQSRSSASNNARNRSASTSAMAQSACVLVLSKNRFPEIPINIG
jgi:hypothetical protein